MDNTILMQKPDESKLQWHKRLIYGKLVDKTLSDYDYTELARYIYDKEYSSDVARRCMYGSKMTLDLLESESMQSISDSSILREIEDKKIELQKERQKFFDYRNAFNKTVREKARQEEIDEIIERSISNSSLPSLEYTHPCYNESTNDIIVSLNDIHYGLAIDNAWTKYNTDICWKMAEKYLERIINIAETHKSENCIVVSAGDLISGNIHYSIAVSNKENVIEQITGVSELISQFLSELSKHFKTVRFISVAGNHSRLNPNKDNSLVAERLDNLVDWYLQARMQNHDNVIIEFSSRIDPTVALFDVRGKSYCCVHGDFDGSDSKVQGLQSMIKDRLYAIISGHKHHNATDNIQGIKTIMGGSFVGTDDYCVQKRIYGKAQQIVCVCDNTGIICYYDIPLEQ